jgi:cation:H+ antiporter
MDATLLIKLAGGLVYLLAGGDLLVRGAVALGRKFHVPPMIIALTVVSFGTSLPELVVVIQATLSGYPGLVLGNVIGSNIANVLLVAGSAAIIYPLTYGEHSVRRDSVFMMVAMALLVGLCWDGSLDRAGGAVLLIGLVAITALTAREAARSFRRSQLKAPLEWVLGLPTKIGIILLFIALGVIALPIGAKLVVDASVRIAADLGVSDTVVGLTVLAIGTSLPELATTVMAAVQKRTDVAVGTIVGSNMFNILAILGLAAAIAPFPISVPGGFFTLDFPVMVGSALVLSMFVWLKRAVGRKTGVLFLVGYAAYIVALLLRSEGAGY